MEGKCCTDIMQRLEKKKSSTKHNMHTPDQTIAK